jgi:hypothetical protein
MRARGFGFGIECRVRVIGICALRIFFCCCGLRLREGSGGQDYAEQGDGESCGADRVDAFAA